MSEQDELRGLREQAARLEAENLQLKGAVPASSGGVDLLLENARLRRQVEQLRGQMPKSSFSPPEAVRGKGPQTYLTVHEVASRLNTTAREAMRLFDKKVPTETDANGMWVIRKSHFEQAVVDISRRRNPSRFL